MAVKLRDLTWPCRSQKFNFHHLRNISKGYKMAVLFQNSGIWFGHTIQACGSAGLNVSGIKTNLLASFMAIATKWCLK